MRLRLYLDECAFSYSLRRFLIEAGHDVQIPADVCPPLTGADDAAHFAHATHTDRVIITFNPDDFKRLHRRFPRHAGIFAVYLDNDRTRDMSDRDIVRAIANLEATGVTIAGGFWPLNNYRW